MKARTIALLWVMAGGMAMAQMAPPSQQVTPEPKPAVKKPMRKAATPEKPTAAQNKPAAPAKAAATTQNKPAAAVKTTSTQKKPAAPAPVSAMGPKAAVVKTRTRHAAKTPADAVKKAAVSTTTAAAAPNKRDPFVSPVREQAGMGPACSTGKKCLAINAMVLRGIVKSQNGMIAVVESAGRRISYFLRENDPVFNGYVVKITPDTIVFRENVMDRLGKQSTRDVTMKVVAPAV